MWLANLPDGLKLHPPEWHFEKILDFAQKKRLIGEPGSNLTLMTHFCEGQPTRERAWRIACYATLYCMPGQVLWQRADIEAAHTVDWFEFLNRNWAGITTRQERRCVRTPQNMATCIKGTIGWIDKELPKFLPSESGWGLDPSTPRQNYDLVWETVTKIPFFGRYISTRFMDGLRRHCGIPAEMPNMRNSSSGGGWSPKKCMVYLYPSQAEPLLDGSKAGDKVADQLVDDIITRFAQRGFIINYYQLAAILCDYRGAFEKRKEYPGWDVDVEPTYYDKIVGYWGTDITKPFYEARSAMFPHEALGEYQGWHGVRPELATTLRDHGYNWSDLKYDYKQSKDHLANPIVRKVNDHPASGD